MNLAIMRVCAVSFFVLLGHAAHAQQQTVPIAPSTMSISGNGEYEVAPEVLNFSGSTSHQADTAASARAAHFAAIALIQPVLNQLAEQGLRIVSSSYSLSVEHPFRYGTNDGLTAEERERTVYMASSSYNFEVTDLAKAGAIISALATTDLQLSADFNFSVRDERAALLEARRAAAGDALGQARAYAEALGVELVGIQSVTDGDARPATEGGEADAAFVVAKPVDIVVPKTISYSGSVDIVWNIRSVAP